MKPRAKSTLIIVGTLLIGIVIGSLGSGTFRGTRGKKLMGMDRQERFKYMLTSMADPDSTQMEPLDSLLDTYSPRFAEQHQQHAEQVVASVGFGEDEVRPGARQDRHRCENQRRERGADSRMGPVDQQMSVA